jgi:hypothetical protein
MASKRHHHKVTSVFAVGLALMTGCSQMSFSDEAAHTENAVVDGAGAGDDGQAQTEGPDFDVEVAYTMARLADLAYSEPAEVERLAPTVGGARSIASFVNSLTGSAAYYFDTRVGPVLAFRGTDQARDWLTNTMAMGRWTDVGIVHEGFAGALDSIWNDGALGLASQGTFTANGVAGLGGYLSRQGCAIVRFTGHSLGGALATIAYSRVFLQPCITDRRLRTSEARERCITDTIGPRVDRLYTFGAPRVGTQIFAKLFRPIEGRFPMVRVVNDGDPVTAVPHYTMPGSSSPFPALQGFYHPSARSDRDDERGGLVLLGQNGFVARGTDAVPTRIPHVVANHDRKLYVSRLNALR